MTGKGSGGQKYPKIWPRGLWMTPQLNFTGHCLRLGSILEGSVSALCIGFMSIVFPEGFWAPLLTIHYSECNLVLHNLSPHSALYVYVLLGDIFSPHKCIVDSTIFYYATLQVTISRKKFNHTKSKFSINRRWMNAKCPKYAGLWCTHCTFRWVGRDTLT